MRALNCWQPRRQCSRVGMKKEQVNKELGLLRRNNLLAEPEGSI